MTDQYRSMGISLLELVQNRFYFLSDMPPIELMVYITQRCVFHLSSGVWCTPPFLWLATATRRRSGVRWASDATKYFIKKTCGRSCISPVSPTLPIFLLFYGAPRLCVQHQKIGPPPHRQLELGYRRV